MKSAYLSFYIVNGEGYPLPTFIDLSLLYNICSYTIMKCIKLLGTLLVVEEDDI